MVLLLALAGCGDPELADSGSGVTGACHFVNGFSGRTDCKEYLGSGWTQDAVDEDCTGPVANAEPGSFEADAPCQIEATIGSCWLDVQGPLEARLVFSEADEDSCSWAEFGCDLEDGVFDSEGVCAN